MAALEAALEMGEPWLDPIVVQQARITVDRSMKRIRLGADHTVVALVGATGSGKSSLFNALARMEIAPVGARRPMTSLPMACVWGEGGSEELLDWLEVPDSLRITRESVLDADLQAPLHGLVLLDLPDHDSTEVIHRVEVDRLVNMVDLLVWVVDPQKYADHALHSRYLQQLVGHDGVMVVVLNQIDRLGAEEADTCVRDLRRLLDGDGLAAVPVLPVSARRGDGVDDLRTLLAGVVQNHSAIADRVGADLDYVIGAVQGELAPAEPGNGNPPGREHLVAELAAAAGVPVVIDAVAAEYRRRGWNRARWPLLSWLRQLRPNRRTDADAEQDLKLIRNGLLPISAPSLRPRVELAIDSAVSASADPLPWRWADAVRDNVSRSGDDLVAALDREVSTVDLELSPPPWWWLATVAQYLLGLAAAVGALWLVLLGLTGLMNSDGIGSPEALGLPLPLVLLLLGLIGGAVVTALSAWVLAVGARRRRTLVQERLIGAVQAVADERVMTPIRVVLSQHRSTRLALSGRHAEPTAAQAAAPLRSTPDSGQLVIEMAEAVPGRHAVPAHRAVWADGASPAYPAASTDPAAVTGLDGSDGLHDPGGRERAGDASAMPTGGDAGGGQQAGPVRPAGGSGEPGSGDTETDSAPVTRRLAV
jgi:GTP-binding protein EngB required for normal cell division